MVNAICHPDKPPRVWMMLSTMGFSTKEAKLASATGEANAVALLRSWMVAISSAVVNLSGLGVACT